MSEFLDHIYWARKTHSIGWGPGLNKNEKSRWAIHASLPPDCTQCGRCLKLLSPRFFTVKTAHSVTGCLQQLELWFPTVMTALKLRGKEPPLPSLGWFLSISCHRNEKSRSYEVLIKSNHSIENFPHLQQCFFFFSPKRKDRLLLACAIY